MLNHHQYVHGTYSYYLQQAILITHMHMETGSNYVGQFSTFLCDSYYELDNKKGNCNKPLGSRRKLLHNLNKAAILERNKSNVI